MGPNRFLFRFCLILAGLSFYTFFAEAYSAEDANKYWASYSSQFLSDISNPQFNLEQLSLGTKAQNILEKELSKAGKKESSETSLQIVSDTAFVVRVWADPAFLDFAKFDQDIIILENIEIKLASPREKTFYNYRAEVQRAFNRPSGSSVFYSLFFPTAHAVVFLNMNQPSLENYIAGLFVTLAKQNEIRWTENGAARNLTLDELIIENSVKLAKYDQSVNSRNTWVQNPITFVCKAGRLESMSKREKFLGYRVLLPKTEASGKQVHQGLQKQFIRSGAGWNFKTFPISNQTIRGRMATSIGGNSADLKINSDGIITEDNSPIPVIRTFPELAAAPCKKGDNRDAMKIRKPGSEAPRGHYESNGISPYQFVADRFSPKRSAESNTCYYPTGRTVSRSVFGAIGDSIYNAPPFFNYPRVAERCCQTKGCYERVSQAFSIIEKTVEANPASQGTGQ
ncbi:MAG: hypothetical protein V4736_13190 [Bdellovibrionota bacterium]